MAPRARSSMKTDKSEPTKEQKAVAHWLRHHVPTKRTKFLHSHVVTYFAGSKAVDALVRDSPWAKKTNEESNSEESEKLVFEYRETAVDYLDELLKHKFFHRARKIPVSTDKKSKKGKENAEAESKKKKKNEKDEKKKRKIRLDMHLDQLFLDSTDAYVWLYDPMPWYMWLGGFAIVLAIIGVCLFPLWPPMMRQGVHYISVAAAGFLGLIILLACLKYCLFGLLFVLSAGRLRLWIFPNLTEDVGFIDSFRPVYDYTYVDTRKKDKDSDDEEEDDEEDENEEAKEDEERGSDASEEASEGGGSNSSSKKSSTTGRDFEMIEDDEEEEKSKKSS